MDGLRKGVCGYSEIAHTADWALQIWAPDLIRLLETAAAGIYSLMGIELQPGERVWRSVEIDSADAEGLLVTFLSELLYLLEEERAAFDEFTLLINDYHLSGMLVGSSVKAQKKEIKAVTFHDLAIRVEPDGLQVTVVFDV